MRRPAVALLTTCALALAYLLAWPVPIDPVVWEAPTAPELEGVYAPNHDLAAAERWSIPSGHGPEDVDVDAQGRIYAGLSDGRVLRWAPYGGPPEEFAHTGGRPLGLRFDLAGTLWIADAVAGLVSVHPSGQVTVRVTEVAGQPLVFTDDLDIATDGTIYYSDASSRFTQGAWKLDLLENRPSGRLLAFHQDTGQSEELLSGLYFANGVAISPDQRFVLVNETSRYRVTRLWIHGPRSGEHEVFIDNLPGFPDGISTGTDGIFWIAIIARPCPTNGE